MNDIRRAISQDETTRAMYPELDELTLTELLRLRPSFKEEMQRVGIKEPVKELMDGLVQYCAKQKEVKRCGLPQM